MIGETRPFFDNPDRSKKVEPIAPTSGANLSYTDQRSGGFEAALEQQAAEQDSNGQFDHRDIPVVAGESEEGERRRLEAEQERGLGSIFNGKG